MESKNLPNQIDIKKVIQYHPEPEYLFSAPDCKPWTREAKNQALLFVFIGFFYFTTLWVGMKEVLREPKLHDYFQIDISENVYYSAHLVATCIILFSFLYRGMHMGDQVEIYIKRFAFMYFLKGITQLVTIEPSPDGWKQCETYTIAHMIQVGNCADMMFSGHTAITYMTCPQHYRWVLIPAIGISLVLSKQHYCADIIMAVITARWIEYEFPLKQKTAAPTEELVEVVHHRSEEQVFSEESSPHWNFVATESEDPKDGEVDSNNDLELSIMKEESTKSMSKCGS